VLVKRLVTIEDLGNIEVLFTDKTGTLTEGAITFDQALDPAGQPARWPLLLGLVCNEATITAQGPVGGNALDRALWSAPAAKLRAADATGGPRAYQRLGLAPFDHDRQLASVAVRTGSGATLLVAKGAPEAVLARCAEVPGDAQATVARLFAAGASLFLSFLPMLPSQILLNNLLYDTGQLAIPTDRVDPETLARPAAWDIGFVRRFMTCSAPSARSSTS
jgi:P-type Mg2+ transporter